MLYQHACDNLTKHPCIHRITVRKCSFLIELLDSFRYSELTIKRRRETSSVTLQQPAHLGKVLTLG
jgi:hypothetical protein